MDSNSYAKPPGQSDLIALAYVSRRIPFASGLSFVSEMHHILASSRHNNALHGVTGALMASHTSFSQILEGQRADVEAIFNKIQADKRHREIRILYRKRILSRDFPHWRMAMAGASDHLSLSVEPVLSDPYGAAAKKITERLMTVLKTLVLAQEADSPSFLRLPMRKWENARDA